MFRGRKTHFLDFHIVNCKNIVKNNIKGLLTFPKHCPNAPDFSYRVSTYEKNILSSCMVTVRGTWKLYVLGPNIFLLKYLILFLKHLTVLFGNPVLLYTLKQLTMEDYWA